jgi:hypothetical protein
MTAAAKVLVIGGYGVFGGRLIQLLEDEPRLNLLVVVQFDAAKEPGGGRSASAASPAANRPDEAGRGICCASILARCGLTWRWWQAASACR